MYNVYQCVDSDKNMTFIPAGSFETRREATRASADIRKRVERNGSKQKAGIWSDDNRLVQPVF